MDSPQFRGKNIGVLNEYEVPAFMLRVVDFRCLVFLYISELLLYLGLCLIILNNLNILSPGSYFGIYSWVTSVVFSIGIIINFFIIPYLYFSSFSNFKKENDFWDRETFWILPLFFFGTFFLYGSNYPSSLILLAISIIVIAFLHLKFVISSWKIMRGNIGESLDTHQQYYVTMKYLTIYYVLLLAVLISFNPMQHVLLWLRMHFA